ncbi:Uncharacterized protein TCM_021762 [Theobroma cacao]|uniref:Uncharacterized protein n=1 Tax=Theobroma cacao TaxID=3641 RepID=A0A061ERL2_THECC|nr:Uncharacterized protein TCM_021762 [Theobroma cacao]
MIPIKQFPYLYLCSTIETFHPIVFKLAFISIRVCEFMYVFLFASIFLFKTVIVQIISPHPQILHVHTITLLDYLSLSNQSFYLVYLFVPNMFISLTTTFFFFC